jgi:hypothetical protein
MIDGGTKYLKRLRLKLKENKEGQDRRSEDSGKEGEWKGGGIIKDSTVNA